MNNEFKKVLQSIVNLETEQKVGLALTAVKDLVPEITKQFNSEKASHLLLAVFSTAISADGKLNSNEFAIIKGFLDAVDIKLTDEQVVKIIADYSGKEAYEAILALNHILSADGKSNLIALVAAVCAIDDRIDPNEVSYLDALYNA